MVDQDKTNEELLSEIKSLQQKYDLLKASFDKETTGLKGAKDPSKVKMPDFETVFISSPVAMLILDETTRIVMVNHAAVKLCCGSDSDILQHRPGNALGCVHSNIDARGCGYAENCKFCQLRNGVESLISNGGSLKDAQLELELSRNGKPEKVWMNVDVEPLLMKNDQRFWCIAINELTDHKKTEHQLIESQTLLNSIIDSTNDLIWSVDAEHFGLLHWNTAFHNYFLKERRVEIAIGMTPTDLFPAGTEFIQRWIDFFMKAKTNGDFSVDYKSFAADRQFILTFNLLYLDDRPFGISVFGKDITQRNEAEKEIRLSEEKFRAAFMTVKDGFYIGTLQEGIIIEMNSGFQNIYQYTPEEAIGKTSTELRLWAVPEDRAIMLNQLKKEGYCNNLETIGRKKNGELFHVSLTASILNIDQVSHIVGVIRDITKQKLAEQEIIRAKNKTEESERKYHKLFNEMIDGFAYHEIICDNNGHPIDYVTLEVNTAYEKYLNVKGELVIGKKASSFLMEEELKHWLGIFGPVAITGQSSQYSLYSPQNHKYFNGKAYCPEKGKFAVTFSDVTEKRNAEIEVKKAQVKVEESEYRLKLATSSGQLGIWDWNLVDNSMIWDERMFELYGISEDTSPNNIEGWTNGLHPDDKERAIAECRAALKGDKDFNTTFRVFHPDGKVIHIKADASIIRDADGKPLRMIGINRDITETKLAEIALRESEKRIQKKLTNLLSPESDISELALEDIIDTTAIQSMMEDFFKFTKIPVAIIDLEGKVLVDPGWQDICTKFHRMHPQTLSNCIECDTVLTKGVPPGTFKSYLCKNNLWDNATPLIIGGRHVGNLFTGQFFYEGEKPDDEVFRAQAARYGFDEHQYMDAVKRVPVYSREVIHDALGFFVTLANMISSLSHANIGLAKVLEKYKQSEAELIKAKDNAEESDRLKSAFLANMSHEIRTPLNSIIGFSELLNDQGFTQEQKIEFTKTIIENGNNLLVIINDILDLSMLEAGQIKIKKGQFPINKLITDLVNEFNTKVNNKGLDFKVNVSSDHLNRIIESDYYRIRQICINLIGNALKFTDNGFIEIGASFIDGAVKFYVKDTGIGIAPEFHDDIFERFRQVDGTNTRKYGGNGLGLVISKNLVELLGGTIRVESEPENGSSFIFTLPVSEHKKG